LKAELARLRDLHPNVLLWEAHSIASVLPRLFDGKLNDFNFGTSDGQSCAPEVAAGAIDAVRRQRMVVGPERSIQGWVHHAALWRAGGGGACGASWR
jgi:N-formylglutamate amidohydrolase